MTRSPRTQRDDRGVVAIELVIVLPILLMLILGTVFVGNFLAEKSAATGFAHAGARAASLGQDLGDVRVDDNTVLTFDEGPCPTASGFVTVRATKPVSLRSLGFGLPNFSEHHEPTATFPCGP
jgi:Flp pilus assembly protein TadG